MKAGRKGANNSPEEKQTKNPKRTSGVSFKARKACEEGEGHDGGDPSGGRGWLLARSKDAMWGVSGSEHPNHLLREAAVDSAGSVVGVAGL